METPGISRYRRPFLAPLWLPLLLAVLLGVMAYAVYRSAGTTVVLLMHPAEKEPGTIADPPLSADGEERAARLGRLLSSPAPGAMLDAIYVSGERRAEQTGELVARQLNLVPQPFKSADAAGAARALLHEHEGGAVLVIADARVAAEMLHTLLGTGVTGIDKDDPDTLYVLSVPKFGRARLVRLRL